MIAALYVVGVVALITVPLVRIGKAVRDYARGGPVHHRKATR